MTPEIDLIPPQALLEAVYRDDLLYSDATWLTAHNAFANKDDGWVYAQQTISNFKFKKI